jgi:hypothetical protein
LIDVTVPALGAGFSFPVAVTATLWQQYVRPPEEVKDQDENGRLWDVLWMLRCAIRHSQERSEIIPFTAHVQNDRQRPRPVKLKAVCGPDVRGKACLTIMLPNED